MISRSTCSCLMNCSRIYFIVRMVQKAKRLTSDHDQGKFVTTCIDLLMYKSPQLFDAALGLLVRKFQTRKALINAVCKVQLITRRHVQNNFKGIVVTSIKELSHMIKTFDHWSMANYPDEDNSENQIDEGTTVAEQRRFSASCNGFLFTVTKRLPMTLETGLSTLKAAETNSCRACCRQWSPMGGYTIGMAAIQLIPRDSRKKGAGASDTRRERIADQHNILHEVQLCGVKLLHELLRNNPKNQRRAFCDLNVF